MVASVGAFHRAERRARLVEARVVPGAHEERTAEVRTVRGHEETARPDLKAVVDLELGDEVFDAEVRDRRPLGRSDVRSRQGVAVEERVEVGGPGEEVGHVAVETELESVRVSTRVEVDLGHLLRLIRVLQNEAEAHRPADAQRLRRPPRAAARGGGTVGGRGSGVAGAMTGAGGGGGFVAPGGGGTSGGGGAGATAAGGGGGGGAGAAAAPGGGGTCAAASPAIAPKSTNAEPRTEGNRDVTRLIGSLLSCQARFTSRGRTAPSACRGELRNLPAPSAERIRRTTQLAEYSSPGVAADFAYINVCGIRARRHEKPICSAIVRS